MLESITRIESSVLSQNTKVVQSERPKTPEENLATEDASEVEEQGRIEEIEVAAEGGDPEEATKKAQPAKAGGGMGDGLESNGFLKS